MKKWTYLYIIVSILSLSIIAQEEPKKFGNKLRDMANGGFGKRMDKMKEDYDESNYNYAISFLDNSALFEADEKGNAFTAALVNNSNLGSSYTSADENTAYNNLRQGEMFMKSKRIFMAEESFFRAADYYNKAGKTESGNYAQVISDLALLYQNRGLYAKAMPYCDSAIALREKLDNKVMLAVSHNNKGVLLKDMGSYTEAEAEIKKAFQICRNENDHLGRALSSNNLAMVYVGMNKLKEASVQMDTAMNYAIQAMPGTSPNYIKLDINHAYIYRLRKLYDDAEGIYKKAIIVKESKLGATPDLAYLKSGLADLYIEMGKMDQVEKLLKQAYDINKRKLGEDHPATIKVMQQQAYFNRIEGRNAVAIDLIQKVVDQKLKIYGESHPSYLNALEELAITQWNLNRIPAAKESFNSVMVNMRHYIDNYFSTLNDNEKNLYWEKTSLTLQKYFSFVLANYKEDSTLVPEMLNNVIATKGFLLNGSAKIKNAILQSDDAELKSTYKKWLETKENLNSAYQLSKEELQQEKINLDSLQKAADDYERILSQKSSLFSSGQSNKSIGYDSIQKILNPDEAVAELVQISEYQNKFTGKSDYVAFLVRKNSLQFINIGKADMINGAIQAFRQSILEQKSELDIYPVVWQQVDKDLAGVNRMFLSMDGSYHQLSVNALRDANSKFMLDKYAIQFIGNSKDVTSLKKDENKFKKPQTAFLIGNPDYGTHDLIEQLPGTETEVKNITKSLRLLKINAIALYGKDATETKLKAVKSPDILHIATHGYFLDDLSQMETDKVLGIDISVAKENPLLRSGLLLANCDNVFDENYHPSGADNGVLTANEALTLNLDNTDLVVLSACETGLGNVKQGEGVYGLQRAFLIAGAKSIIMSLWSVNDEATMELMSTFYNNYAKTGNKQLAFSEAQKKLKEKYKDPFYWGAFVMLNI